MGSQFRAGSNEAVFKVRFESLKPSNEAEFMTEEENVFISVSTHFSQSAAQNQTIPCGNGGF